ncbi:MAG: hypothetical protein NXI22_14130 [bacterium]|nr:hypothetical protein [bacterium]
MVIQRSLCYCTLLLTVLGAGTAVHAEPVIPGTGEEVTKVGDDFEDAEWRYVPNNPKSTYNIDEKWTNNPSSYSINRRWYEGMKRGHPDVVKRIATPKGGLPGSEGAMLMQTLKSSYHNRITGKMQQDDLVCSIMPQIGAVSSSQSPSCVVRVFLPPIKQWEQRSGPTFGFRIACDTIAWKKEEREMGQEIYWPGMFILLQKGRENDYAYINIRGARNGGDYKAKQIETTGWWTMGISVSPDGMVHYYAKPGIEDLTEEDRIGSQYPYGYKAHHFRAFFFNVCNFDNGRNWSTPWVVDDCKFYIIPRGTAGQYIMRR